MSEEELVLRAERLRILYAANSVEEHLDPVEAVLPHLNDEERALMMASTEEDLELAAAVLGYGRKRRRMQWVALQEVLAYMRPGERPWDTHARLPGEERGWFLRCLAVSGWWRPPENLDV